MKTMLLLLTACLCLPLPAARADTQPLPPEQVYRPEVHARNGVIMAHWDILPGYYLYKDKFQFTSHSPGITLGAPQFPAGETHTDPYFGTQTIYRNGVTVGIPYSGSGPLQLEVGYQGCADMGFCYPPQSRQFNLTLAQRPPRVSPAATPLCTHRTWRHWWAAAATTVSRRLIRCFNSWPG